MTSSVLENPATTKYVLIPFQCNKINNKDTETVFELHGSQRELSSHRVRTGSHESTKVKNLRGSLISEGVCHMWHCNLILINAHYPSRCDLLPLKTLN